MNIDNVILNSTSNNLFELLKIIGEKNILSEKKDMFKLIHITLKLSSNNKDTFKIMNVTFNSMEVFSNFKFIVKNDDCYITAAMSDWMIFCKTIINNWTYDSKLLAMFIIKITDFVNTEYNNYISNNQVAFELNTYQEYFGIDDDTYNMLYTLTSELTKTIGTAYLANYNIVLSRYNNISVDDLNTIFNYHKDTNKVFYNYVDKTLSALSI